MITSRPHDDLSSSEAEISVGVAGAVPDSYRNIHLEGEWSNMQSFSLSRADLVYSVSERCGLGALYLSDAFSIMAGWKLGENWEFVVASSVSFLFLMIATMFFFVGPLEVMRQTQRRNMYVSDIRRPHFIPEHQSPEWLYMSLAFAYVITRHGLCILCGMALGRNDFEGAAVAAVPLFVLETLVSFAILCSGLVVRPNT